MNLKDIVTVKTGTKEGVKVSWEDDQSVGFLVAYCGRDILNKARKNSTEKRLNNKTHQIEEIIADDKFDREIMDAVLVGWWGLKVKHLKQILDLSIEIKVDEKDLEKDVEFTSDNKQIILNTSNLTFGRFITGVALDIETYRRYQEEQAIKN